VLKRSLLQRESSVLVTTKLETEFENALRGAARECIHKYRYRPTYFLSMLAERGGVTTARTLLGKSAPSSGFTKLVVDYGRPDLTMEHFVATPKYAPLFEPDEIAKARRWLGNQSIYSAAVGLAPAP
jgi:hypothetical protein